MQLNAFRDRFDIQNAQTCAFNSDINDSDSLRHSKRPLNRLLQVLLRHHIPQSAHNPAQKSSKHYSNRSYLNLLHIFRRPAKENRAPLQKPGFLSSQILNIALLSAWAAWWPKRARDPENHTHVHVCLHHNGHISRTAERMRVRRSCLQYKLCGGVTHPRP